MFDLKLVYFFLGHPVVSLYSIVMSCMKSVPHVAAMCKILASETLRFFKHSRKYVFDTQREYDIVDDVIIFS